MVGSNPPSLGGNAGFEGFEEATVTGRMQRLKESSAEMIKPTEMQRGPRADQRVGGEVPSGGPGAGGVMAGSVP